LSLGHRFPTRRASDLGLTVVVGPLAFAAVGVLLGAVLPTARAAQGIGVLLWFVMLMISGGGPPPEVLSPTLRRIGDFTPLQHLRVALQDAWLGRGVHWTEVLVLLGVLVVCAGAALPALRRRT
jgi:ABC-2 type transport system permease protein